MLKVYISIKVNYGRSVGLQGVLMKMVRTKVKEICLRLFRPLRGKIKVNPSEHSEAIRS